MNQQQINDQSTTKSTTNQQSIDYEELINHDIFELMGAKDMPEEKKKELYTKILETIQNRAIAYIANQLTGNDLEEWKKVAATKDKQKEDEFLKNKNIDIAQIMLQQTIIYKAEMVELMKLKRGQNA